MPAKKPKLVYAWDARESIDSFLRRELPRTRLLVGRIMAERYFKPVRVRIEVVE